MKEELTFCSRYTEYLELEKEVSALQIKYGGIFMPEQVSADATLLMSDDGTIQEVNGNFLEWAHKTRNDVIGINISQLEQVVDTSFIAGTTVSKGFLCHRTYFKPSEKAVIAYYFPLDDFLSVSMSVIIFRDVSMLESLASLLSKTQTARMLAEAPSGICDEGVYGNSVVSSRLTRQLLAVSNTDASVLLLGETGVGKEHAARVIYNHSARRNGPFIKVNCATIPENLFESEFYGYERGTFTGATTTGKVGFFEAADGGTLFLDEVAELPLTHQPKLLRALQTGEFMRLGSVQTRKANVRIIAATNRDLQQMIQAGEFREDLFYRINTMMIRLPSLRERREDIPLFIRYLLNLANRKYAQEKTISVGAVKTLVEYSWPGNVRELNNIIERLVILSGDTILEDDVMRVIDMDSAVKDMSYTAQMNAFKKQLVEAALKETGSTYKAASALKISQSALYRMAKKYGLL